MTLAWIGGWLLLCFALCGDPFLFVDERLPQEVAWWALAAAMLCFALRRPATHPAADGSVASAGSAWAWLVAVGLIGALLVPVLRIRVGFALVGCSGLAARIGAGRASRLVAAASLAGNGLLLLELTKWLLWPVLARVHELPALTAMAAASLRLAGIDARAGTDAIALPSADAWTAVTIAAEKLALGPLALLTVVSLWLFAGRIAARRAACITVLVTTALAYAWVRMLVLSAAVADGLPVGVFYETWPVLLSLAPLPLLWRLALAWTPRAAWQRSEAAPPLHSPTRASLALVAALLLSICASAHDPGVRKGGRILVDEAHSEWERTDAPLDRTLYGNKTTYNYFSMVDHLRSYYPVVDRNYGPLDGDVLDACDVLILKTPTLLYSDDEVAAMLRFVERGGGIWLIGDHTDVFGSSTCLNQIARPLGVRLVVDSLDDVVPHEKQIYRRPDLGRHPTNQWMPECLLATGCSLELDWGVDASMTGGTLWGDRPIYGNVNFIGDVSIDADERFGIFAQGAAGSHGAGRFSVFTDSTSLSNFTYFFPGKWEHALAVVEWLNHRAGNRWFLMLRGLGWTAAAALLLWLRRRGAGNELIRTPYLVTIAALGLFGGLAITDRLAAATHPMPEPHSSPVVVAFEREHCDYKLPLVHETHYWDTDSYQTVFVWAQRVGLVPRVADTLDEAMEHDCLVLIRPRRSFTREELQRLRAHVERGGRLLVVDEYDVPGSTAGDVLALFSMRFGEQVSGVGIDLEALAAYLPGSRLDLPSALTVRGGTPFLRTTDGKVVGAACHVGRGVVAALGLARSWAVDRYGSVQGTPSQEQIALAEIEYHVLQQVLLLHPSPPACQSRSVPEAGVVVAGGAETAPSEG